MIVKPNVLCSIAPKGFACAGTMWNTSMDVEASNWQDLHFSFHITGIDPLAFADALDSAKPYGKDVSIKGSDEKEHVFIWVNAYEVSILQGGKSVFYFNGRIVTDVLKAISKAIRKEYKKHDVSSWR